MEDCTTNPCDLCRLRAQYEGIFVAVNKDGKAEPPYTHYMCGSCLALHPEIDVSADETQVWCVESYGWLGPIECIECGDEIPVIVEDGQDECG